MSAPLRLIVGIGNPGEQYARTLHNAGVWFVTRFAERQGVVFKEEKKFFGRVAVTHYEGQELRLLIPNTYMNHSGKSVGALANFFKIEPEQMLIAHDELDLPVGAIRFKQGGGLAGHNGLKDITRALAGSKEYNRLRIGVGHPGEKEAVIGHVLGTVSKRDESIIEQCLDEALYQLPKAVSGDWQNAMNALNGFSVSA
ncbi:MAG: aminoacyl-tRNA hydrolase [Pseudomonadales bacterium]|nr:aminoacyl-tRNA hydrolase [Pseudomonadales bacterium]